MRPGVARSGKNSVLCFYALILPAGRFFRAVRARWKTRTTPRTAATHGPFPLFYLDRACFRPTAPREAERPPGAMQMHDHSGRARAAGVREFIWQGVVDEAQ